MQYNRFRNSFSQRESNPVQVIVLCTELKLNSTQLLVQAAWHLRHPTHVYQRLHGQQCIFQLQLAAGVGMIGAPVISISFL